jgi:hypothetical protein
VGGEAAWWQLNGGDALAAVNFSAAVRESVGELER